MMTAMAVGHLIAVVVSQGECSLSMSQVLNHLHNEAPENLKLF